MPVITLEVKALKIEDGVFSYWAFCRLVNILSSNGNDESAMPRREMSNNMQHCGKALQFMEEVMQKMS